MFNAILAKVSAAYTTTKAAATAAYVKLQPTLTAASKTISNALATCKDAVYVFKGLLTTAAKTLKTAFHTGKAILYTGKVVAYDTPSYIANAYGEHVDAEGYALPTQQVEQAIATSWNTVTADAECAKDNLNQAATAAWQTLEDGAATLQHTAHFSMNAGATLYSAAETIVDASLVAKDAAGYVFENAIIPALQYAGENVAAGKQYICEVSAQRQQKLVWLADLKQAQAAETAYVEEPTDDADCVLVSIRAAAPAA